MHELQYNFPQTSQRFGRFKKLVNLTLHEKHFAIRESGIISLIFVSSSFGSTISNSDSQFIFLKNIVSFNYFLSFKFYYFILLFLF